MRAGRTPLTAASRTQSATYVGMSRFATAAPEPDGSPTLAAVSRQQSIRVAMGKGQSASEGPFGTAVCCPGGERAWPKGAPRRAVSHPGTSSARHPPARSREGELRGPTPGSRRGRPCPPMMAGPARCGAPPARPFSDMQRCRAPMCSAQRGRDAAAPAAVSFTRGGGLASLSWPALAVHQPGRQTSPNLLSPAAGRRHPDSPPAPCPAMMHPSAPCARLHTSARHHSPPAPPAPPAAHHSHTHTHTQNSSRAPAPHHHTTPAAQLPALAAAMADEAAMAMAASEALGR